VGLSFGLLQRMPGLSLPIVVIFDGVGIGGPSVLLRMILGTNGGRRLDCLHDLLLARGSIDLG
jgi:hypothetical protein